RIRAEPSDIAHVPCNRSCIAVNHVTDFRAECAEVFPLILRHPSHFQMGRILARTAVERAGRNGESLTRQNHIPEVNPGSATLAVHTKLYRHSSFPLFLPNP